MGEWMSYEQAKEREEYYALRHFELLKRMAKERRLTGLDMIVVHQLPEDQRNEILEIIKTHTIV